MNGIIKPVLVYLDNTDCVMYSGQRKKGIKK